MSVFLQAILAAGFSAGLAEGFRRYGVPLDTIDLNFVGGQPYICARPVNARRPGVENRLNRLPSPLIVKGLFLVHPEFRRRWKMAQRAFETKLWRTDRSRWRHELADAYRRANLELQRIDPSLLGPHALRQHVAAVASQLQEGLKLHLAQAPASAIPVGDWADRTCGWTGASPAEVVAALRQANAGSRVMIELVDRVAEKVREVPSAVRILAEPGDPRERLLRLRASSRQIATTLDAYLEEHGNRLVTGFDLTDYTLAEMPELLTSMIRARMGAKERRDSPPHETSAAMRLRQLVSPAFRRKYDEALTEACAAYGFHDEDIGILVLWPLGLLRRALLAAGRALVARGVLERAEEVFDATADEVEALLGGPGDVPDSAELARRINERSQVAAATLPSQFGPDSPSASPQSLPAPCLRVARAMWFYVQHLYGIDRHESSIMTYSLLSGVAASPGRYEGRAHIVASPADFEKLQQGDVLIARMTSPTYNVVFPLLGAIVTDRGGVLSHSAIIAREFGIPAVVGTGRATSVIPDGVRVLVDGDKGVVEVLQ